jgi:hypothetical protein
MPMNFRFLVPEVYDSVGSRIVQERTHLRDDVVIDLSVRFFFFAFVRPERTETIPIMSVILAPRIHPETIAPYSMGPQENCEIRKRI